MQDKVSQPLRVTIIPLYSDEPNIKNGQMASLRVPNKLKFKIHQSTMWIPWLQGLCTAKNMQTVCKNFIPSCKQLLLQKNKHNIYICWPTRISERRVQVCFQCMPDWIQMNLALCTPTKCILHIPTCAFQNVQSDWIWMIVNFLFNKESWPSFRRLIMNHLNASMSRWCSGSQEQMCSGETLLSISQQPDSSWTCNSTPRDTVTPEGLNPVHPFISSNSARVAQHLKQTSIADDSLIIHQLLFFWIHLPVQCPL